MTLALFDFAPMFDAAVRGACRDVARMGDHSHVWIQAWSRVYCMGCGLEIKDFGTPEGERLIRQLTIELNRDPHNLALQASLWSIAHMERQIWQEARA